MLNVSFRFTVIESNRLLDFLDVNNRLPEKKKKKKNHGRLPCVGLSVNDDQYRVVSIDYLGVIPFESLVISGIHPEAIDNLNRVEVRLLRNNTVTILWVYWVRYD